MSQLWQKLAYVLLGAALVIGVQLASATLVEDAGATVEPASVQAGMQSGKIKVVATVNYPLGGKAEYLQWVRSIGPALQAPAEVQRIASYDNYFGAAPNRFIEWEFADFAAYATYMQRPEIRNVWQDLVNHGHGVDVHVLVQRSDYTKN